MYIVQRAAGELTSHFLRFSTLNAEQRGLLYAEAQNSSYFEDIVSSDYQLHKGQIDGTTSAI